MFKTNIVLPESIAPSIIFREDSPLKEGNGGILGTNWFADKAWHFKYKEERLFVIDSLNWNAASQSKTVDLGFLENNEGNHSSHFPRIPITVEGDTIQTLFDTGAHTILTEEAKPVFRNRHSVASSFIVASIFDRWHSENPNWEFVKAADSLANEAMIRVPLIKIGNYEVGPVWFTRRADNNFTEYMSQWTDQKIYGAIGGSAFKYFDSIILDYRNEIAFFEK